MKTIELKKIRLLALSAAIVGVCAAGPASAQIVQNCSFEDPLVTDNFDTAPPQPIADWMVTSGSVDLIGSYWQAHDGSQSIDLNGLGPGTLSQDVTLQTGQLYGLSFWVSGNPDGEPLTKTFDFSISNTAPATVANVNFFVVAPPQSRENMNWEQRQFFFVAGAGTHTLTFRSTTLASAYGPALDDVSITAIPEPATTALLLSGFGLMGFVARRRSSGRA